MRHVISTGALRLVLRAMAERPADLAIQARSRWRVCHIIGCPRVPTTTQRTFARWTSRSGRARGLRRLAKLRLGIRFIRPGRLMTPWPFGMTCTGARAAAAREPRLRRRPRARRRARRRVRHRARRARRQPARRRRRRARAARAAQRARDARVRPSLPARPACPSVSRPPFRSVFAFALSLSLSSSRPSGSSRCRGRCC